MREMKLNENEKIQKAKGKLIKAATLINDASGILIKEIGGSQDVMAAQESVLKAVSNLNQIEGV